MNFGRLAFGKALKSKTNSDIPSSPVERDPHEMAEIAALHGAQDQALRDVKEVVVKEAGTALRPRPRPLAPEIPRGHGNVLIV
jgi:hypothetical protein